MLLGNESGSLIKTIRDICNKIMHVVLHSHDSVDSFQLIGTLPLHSMHSTLELSLLIKQY